MVLTLGGRWCHGQGSVGEGAALDKGECEELPLSRRLEAVVGVSVSREGDPGRILGDPHTTRQEEVGEERSGKDENWEGELQSWEDYFKRTRSTFPNAPEKENTGPDLVWFLQRWAPEPSLKAADCLQSKQAAGPQSHFHSVVGSRANMHWLT